MTGHDQLSDAASIASEIEQLLIAERTGHMSPAFSAIRRIASDSSIDSDDALDSIHQYSPTRAEATAPLAAS
jgi:hypothetical protein